MTRLRKIRTVATFEFLSTVKRPGYLIATFGMPLFMALYAGIVAVPAYYAEHRDRDAAVHGVVDLAGVMGLQDDVAADRADGAPEGLRRAMEAAGRTGALDRALGPARFVFRPFESEAGARAALSAGDIRAYFVLPDDYVREGVLIAYSRSDAAVLGGSGAGEALAGLIRRRLLGDVVDPGVAARILRPIAEMQQFAVSASGEVRDAGGAAQAVRLFVPLLFMVLFLLSVLMTSGYLMQGTATEKENKVIEVLLASADPDEILAGKLLGLGGAGLLQIAVWLGIVVGSGVGVLPLLFAAQVSVPWTALALAVPFFAVAFLFFGSLILGTASLGSNMREAQQLAMVWSLTAALPLMLLPILMREPNGPLSRTLTWIPFSAGPIVVLRTSADAALVGWWEIAGAFAVLAGSTWVALRVGARLFRIGLLSGGSRPSLREVARQARLQG